MKKLVKLAKTTSPDFNLLPTTVKTTDPANPPPAPPASIAAPVLASEQHVKYTTFARDSVDYNIACIGHPIGLQTKYNTSSLQNYTIQLRKPQDKVLKQQ
jgi:hypothetical protein